MYHIINRKYDVLICLASAITYQRAANVKQSVSTCTLCLDTKVKSFSATPFD